MLLGLALVPSDEDSRALVDYAEAVGRLGHAVAHLGLGALPHVSVIHVWTRDDPAEVWAGVPGQDVECVVRPAGLHVYPFTAAYNAAGSVSSVAEVPIEVDDAFAELRRRVLASRVPQRGEVTVGAPGPFRPHFTLAVFDGRLSGSVPLPSFSFRPMPCRLHLGIIGAHGVLERTLFP
jgi:hypothetical protein